MRLELSKRTDIGIHALRYLAASDVGTPVPRAELAAATDTTPSYLPQALNPLVKRGWIESRPGIRGGYSIGRSPEEISVLDLIEAVEGPLDDGTCVLHHAGCPDVAPCAMHVPWSRARDALRNELAATAVAECKEPGHPQGGGND